MKKIISGSPIQIIYLNKRNNGKIEKYSSIQRSTEIWAVKYQKWKYSS